MLDIYRNFNALTDYKQSIIIIMRDSRYFIIISWYTPRHCSITRFKLISGLSQLCAAHSPAVRVRDETDQNFMNSFLGVILLMCAGFLLYTFAC